MGGYVARVAERRPACRDCVGGNVMEIDHLHDLGVEGRIVFKWTTEK